MCDTFEKARAFIYRNARPLDLARWQYHFENGSKDDVINALSYYQNADGGFGNAMEPDSWNPNSSPIATWAATEVLREIAFSDSAHPVVAGILRYLESGSDFDNEHRQWLNVVQSNNDFPHAVWWKYGENGSEFKYNPTASLAGFLIKFANRESKLYAKGVEIAKEAFAFLKTNAPFDEQHITTCFINLYNDCLFANAKFLDMDSFEAILMRQVNCCINRNCETWFTEYHTKPSDFILSKDSIFYSGNEELVRRECELLIENQQQDGGFPITWSWWTEYPEFHISANWWRGSFVIANIRFLKNFSQL